MRRTHIRRIGNGVADLFFSVIVALAKAARKVQTKVLR
jgi:hypothetical protein